MSRSVNQLRLMTAAPPGAIWLERLTAQRARARSEVIHVGQRAFKGFRRGAGSLCCRARVERP
jgi:hypothetical protein